MDRLRSGWRGLTKDEWRRRIAAVAGSIAFRWVCFVGMIWISLHAEVRHVPGNLPDFLLERIPYVEVVDRWNYVLWLLCYIPMGLVLLGLNPKRFVRFMVTGGILSLIRGLCIVATGLPRVSGWEHVPVEVVRPRLLRAGREPTRPAYSVEREVHHPG